MNRTPFSGFGVSAKDAIKAYQRMFQVLGGNMELPVFFKMKKEYDSFRATWYNPDEHDAIVAWFEERNIKPFTINGHGWHATFNSSDVALLAKLTWGGAQ